MVSAHLVKMTPLVVGALGALAVPAPALAATAIGEATGSGTQICTTNYTWVQDATASSSPSYAVPAGGGVITRWSHTVSSDTPAGATMRLKVFRKTGANAYLTIGQSDVETLNSAGLRTFATRIGVQAGDLLGLRTGGTEGTDCYRTGQSGDVAVEQTMPGLPDPPVGTTFNSSVANAFVLDVAAVVEPDADSDGYGDETQDQCVGSAGAANGCPSTVTIDKLKQKGDTKLKVTVTVPGAGTLEVGSPSDPALASAAAKKRLKAVTKTLTATTKQQLKLTLKLTKSAIGKLDEAGKLKVKVKAVYTPVGGPAGSQTKKKKLKT